MKAIVFAHTCDLELGWPHHPSYYRNNFSRVAPAKIGDLQRELEFIAEDSGADAGALEFPQDWSRWLRSSGNYCAWTRFGAYTICVAEGRRHGVPWPQGLPLPEPATVWDPERCRSGEPFEGLAPTQEDGSARPYHEAVNSRITSSVTAKLVWVCRRLGFPRPQTWGQIWGFGEAPTVTYAYWETRTNALLPWQTTS